IKKFWSQGSNVFEIEGHFPLFVFRVIAIRTNAPDVRRKLPPPNKQVTFPKARRTFIKSEHLTVRKEKKSVK
ncbi:18253_t:CDS:1, partial [Acaulospora morrowiae]